MGKSSKKKEPVNLTPQFSLPAGAEPSKKKKKNAPDRQQPEWMFPPDEENPVLNPKPKSDAKNIKEQEERNQSIKYLHHKSVSAPMMKPPPALLITLVGGFLSHYGFHSTSRIYTTQVKSRKKLDAWKVELGQKLPKGFPDLVKIFNDWYREYEERHQMDATSSSDENDNDGTRAAKRSRKDAKSETKAGASVITKADETSSSGGNGTSDEESGSEDDSDVEMKGAIPATKKANKANKVAKTKSSSPSTSSSSSDSEADEDNEATGAKLSQTSTLQKPAVDDIVSNLKSKIASTSPSTSSDSNSEPDSDKLAEEPSVAPSADSSSPDSDPDSGLAEPAKPSKQSTSNTKKSPSKPAASSDSSETLQAASALKPSTAATSLSSSSSSSDSSSDSSNSSSPKQPTTSTKRKRSASPSAAAPSKKKVNTPFQRVPKDTVVDPKMASNAYRSYDYADKAHQDLSVTRGKGFTKEKNKKKKGTYKGGAIDVSGGKGTKFND